MTEREKSLVPLKESLSDLQLKAAIYLACIRWYFVAKICLPLSFLVIVIQEICVKIVITSITNRLINAIEHSSSTSSIVYTYEEWFPPIVCVSTHHTKNALPNNKVDPTKKTKQKHTCLACSAARSFRHVFCQMQLFLTTVTWNNTMDLALLFTGKLFFHPCPQTASFVPSPSRGLYQCNNVKWGICVGDISGLFLCSISFGPTFYLWEYSICLSKALELANMPNPPDI